MASEDDYKIEIAHDKPSKGMWHTGPNPAWVTVTHLPTMISARMLDHSEHKARDAALTCVQMMVDQSRCDKCSFPEVIEPSKSD